MRRIAMRGEGCFVSASMSSIQLSSGPYISSSLSSSTTTPSSATTDIIRHYQLKHIFLSFIFVGKIDNVRVNRTRCFIFVTIGISM